jgi:beta-glucosidase
VVLDLDADQDVEVLLTYRPTGGAALGGSEVTMLTVQLNVAPQYDERAEFDRAVQLASEADVAVVVVGTTEEVESEGFDRTSLALPGRQDDLVRAVAAANPRTIVVVNAGAPVLLPWADDVAAVLLAWFPGQEFGHALADVLLGVAEPGGRLPVTWSATEQGLPPTTPTDGVLAYDEGLLIGYRWYDDQGREPRYRFGHGLGYTSWDYQHVDAELDQEGTVTLQVRLKNTGTRLGRDVVQVYASRPDSAVPRPRRWLVGFAPAAAGDELTIPVVIPLRALRHWGDTTHAWRTEPGTFDLHVARPPATCPCTLPSRFPAADARR